MSWLDLMTRDGETLGVTYSPVASYRPARVQLILEGSGLTLIQVNLTMDHARQLAEVLPGLVMAHDAAEHAAREQAAAQAEAV